MRPPSKITKRTSYDNNAQKSDALKSTTHSIRPTHSTRTFLTPYTFRAGILQMGLGQARRNKAGWYLVTQVRQAELQIRIALMSQHPNAHAPRLRHHWLARRSPPRAPTISYTHHLVCVHSSRLRAPLATLLNASTSTITRRSTDKK